MGHFVLQAAKVKDCEVVAEWAELICNHFWHIAETCNGDVERLKVMKLYFVLLWRIVLFLFAFWYVMKLKAQCELVSKSPIAKNLHNVFKRIFIVLSLSGYSAIIYIQIYYFHFFFRIVGLEFCTIYVEGVNGLMDHATMVHW